MPTNTVPSSVKLPQSLRERLKNLANARNQSAHAVMVQAIESYVEREEKREALRQEARTAHEHFMLTGLHLSNTEIIEWMDKVIQGEKASLPKCHI
jgi:predicted transcriptional regulator